MIPAMRFANSIPAQAEAIRRQPRASRFSRSPAQLRRRAPTNGASVPIALGVGVTQAQIDALEGGRIDDAAFNAAERALLAFSKHSVENVRVPRAGV